jgi:hypothetical protein
MLSSLIVGGPQDGDEHIVGGSAFQWVLANNGTITWQEGTTLRLIAGPIVMHPIVEVLAVDPGQTVILDLEVQDVKEPAEVFYTLVTPDGQPFGDIAMLKVAPKQEAPNPKALCVVAASPMDGNNGPLETLQGEVKCSKWTLANIGVTPWPEDVHAVLIYNTPGFANLPGKIDIPLVQPGMTVEVELEMLMPEMPGHVKAMWAVVSPTNPEFGEILHVEFNVDEFPFMEWMLAETKLDTISNVSSQEQQVEVAKEEPKKVSMCVAMINHLLPEGCEVQYPDEGTDPNGTFSLGRVVGMNPDTNWVLEVVLANDGDMAWPSGSMLTCCFGPDIACSPSLIHESVEIGETVALRMELRAPAEPGCTAWIMSVDGDACFGPFLTLEMA